MLKTGRWKLSELDEIKKNGLKVYRFLETLIYEKCKGKKDIYGEN